MSTYSRPGLPYLIAPDFPAILRLLFLIHSRWRMTVPPRSTSPSLFTQQHFVAITSTLRRNLLLTHFRCVTLPKWEVLQNVKLYICIYVYILKNVSLMSDFKNLLVKFSLQWWNKVWLKFLISNRSWFDGWICYIDKTHRPHSSLSNLCSCLRVFFPPLLFSPFFSHSLKQNNACKDIIHWAHTLCTPSAMLSTDNKLASLLAGIQPLFANHQCHLPRICLID